MTSIFLSGTEEKLLVAGCQLKKLPASYLNFLHSLCGNAAICVSQLTTCN
jgi:hypothetical protein